MPTKQLFLCDDCEPDTVAGLCREFDCGIEVQSFYDPAYAQREPDGIEHHRTAIAGIVGRALHGPFGDLVPGSFDPMVREVARYRFEEAVRVARALDIHHIILHHGYIPGTSMPARWIERCGTFWREFLRDKENELRVHIENHLDRNPQMLLDLLGAIDDSRADLCLDVGHVHGCVKGNVVEWVGQLGDRIGYVHLHDNHGESDEHLGLGDGTMPIVDVCAALEACAPEAIWALESRVQSMRQSIEWIRHQV